MMKVLLLTFALLACVPVTSRAAMLGAEGLMTACSGDAVGRATCNGYLMAAAGKAIAQARDAVLNHGDGQAALRAADALRLVVRTMRITWPRDAPPKQQ